MSNEPLDDDGASRIATPIGRGELYRLVWSVPGRILGPRLGVSDTYLGFVCTALDVPRPSRGHWKRVAAGMTVVVPLLPEARPGRPTTWTKGHGCPTPIKGFFSKRDLALQSGQSLVALSAEILGSARTGPDGIHLATRSTRVIDVTTSKNCLRKALAYAKALYTALEGRGHEVTIATGNVMFRPDIDFSEGRPGRRGMPLKPRPPAYPTIAIVNGTPVGLAIGEVVDDIEMTYVGDGRFVPRSETLGKRANTVAGFTWSEWRAHSTGRLKLVAYAPHRLNRWRREWIERPRTKLISSVKEAVSDIEALVDLLPGDRTTPPLADASPQTFEDQPQPSTQST